MSLSTHHNALYLQGKVGIPESVEGLNGVEASRAASEKLRVELLCGANVRSFNIQVVPSIPSICSSFYKTKC